MSHAYARNYVHLIFGTKDRRRQLKPPVQEKLWPYLASTAHEYNVEVVAIGGGEDHIHLLVSIPPKLAIAPLVRALKANSSKWMNAITDTSSPGSKGMVLSASNVNAVAEYVRSQAEHHRKRDFREEFMALLRRHGIEFTPEKVFG